MQFTESRGNDGLLILKMNGRLDIEGSGEIGLRLTTATAGDKVRVVADLAGVDFMSSIGIGVLVRVAQSVRRRGGNLVILDPQPVVRLILEKTQIQRIITLHDTLDEAVVAVKGEPPIPSSN
jgi:anti-sigma B factor antagonist